MSQAKSQVQVSIVASLGKDFVQAFTAADKRMATLGKSAQELNKKIGSIDGFKKQQEAVKQAGYSWQAAKAKADQFREAVAAQGAPTRKQAAELARLERATDKAGAAFSKERQQLAEMGAALQKAGVNTSKLTAEQERLTKQLNQAQAAHERAEKSLARQRAIVTGMATAWSKIQQHAAGAVAAGAVVGAAGRKALPYDEQLSRLADTATAGKGQAEFKSAKGELSAAIQAALKAAGGGSREEVLAGLNTLIATGNLSTSEATKLLPDVARGVFGGGASGEEIAGIMLKARGFGVDGGRALDIAHRGGQLGGVELRDMAKALPEQLGSARSAGYSGDKGLAAIVAMNQIALSTAGDPGQAANNVTNLLNKLSSPELSKNISKVAGVDFDKYALARAQKGVFKAESFAEVADKKMSSNAEYRALKKKAETAKGSEKGAIINNMAAMMEGSGMGQLIQDRQALAAALSLMFARKTKGADGRSQLESMTADILDSKGAIGGSTSRLGGETFAKVQMANEGLNAANENTFNALSGPLGKMLDGFNNLTDAFPKLTTAAYGAVTALSAVAAWGVVGGVVGKVLGPGAAGAAAGAAAGGAGAGVAAGGAAAAGAAGKGLLGRLGARAMLGRAGVAGLLSWGAIEAGEATGILKQNDEERGKVALDKGNYFEASRYMSAGSFLSGAFNRMTGGGGTPDAAAKAAAEAATAAQAASDSASKAVTAVQQRPNITNQNTYNLTVNAGPEAGSAEAADQIMRTIRLHEKQKAAEQRSSMFGNPAY